MRIISTTIYYICYLIGLGQTSFTSLMVFPKTQFWAHCYLLHIYILIDVINNIVYDEEIQIFKHNYLLPVCAS